MAMRVSDHSTEPIPPTTTDRLRIWPSATGPIPEVGDFWDLAHSEPVHEGVIFPYGPPPAIGLPPSRPVTRVSGWATAALTVGLVAVPLSLVGVGAILGVLAVGLGVGGVVHAGGAAHRGKGRAVTGIILGAGSAVVGTPILLVMLGLLALLG